jgi:ribosomal protein S18 acetylase RimI-like enzyme
VNPSALPPPRLAPRSARLSDAESIGAVQVASWRSTYRGIVPDDYLDAMTVEDHAGRWGRLLARPGSLELTFVVEEEGRVVGFAMGGTEREGDRRYAGELYAIYLLPDARRRGHGRALAEAVSEALLERGLRSMLVWVLRDNLGARRFYERLGGVYVREHELDFGAGFTLPEVSYGWADLRWGLVRPHL